MKNKVAYRMMLERLNSRAWEENDERVVAEVQKIAKLTENKEKTRRKRVGRKIAIWQGGRILVTGTAQELSEVTSIDKKTIWSRVRRGNVDSKGRKFKYLEDK